MFPRSRIRENSDAIHRDRPNSHESGDIQPTAFRFSRTFIARAFWTALAVHERLGNSKPNGRQQP